MYAFTKSNVYEGEGLTEPQRHPYQLSIILKIYEIYCLNDDQIKEALQTSEKNNYKVRTV